MMDHRDSDTVVVIIETVVVSDTVVVIIGIVIQWL